MAEEQSKRAEEEQKVRDSPPTRITLTFLKYNGDQLQHVQSMLNTRMQCEVNMDETISSIMQLIVGQENFNNSEYAALIRVRAHLVTFTHAVKPHVLPRANYGLSACLYARFIDRARTCMAAHRVTPKVCVASIAAYSPKPNVPQIILRGMQLPNVWNFADHVPLNMRGPMIIVSPSNSTDRVISSMKAQLAILNIPAETTTINLRDSSGVLLFGEAPMFRLLRESHILLQQPSTASPSTPSASPSAQAATVSADFHAQRKVRKRMGKLERALVRMGGRLSESDDEIPEATPSSQ